jgi:hypothetical protein
MHTFVYKGYYITETFNFTVFPRHAEYPFEVHKEGFTRSFKTLLGAKRFITIKAKSEI